MRAIAMKREYLERVSEYIQEKSAGETVCPGCLSEGSEKR
jgi:hypothetical protein